MANPKKHSKPLQFDSAAVISQLKSFASERLDGFCIVGFVAGSNEPIIIKPQTDLKTYIALNQVLVSAAQLPPSPPSEASEPT